MNEVTARPEGSQGITRPARRYRTMLSGLAGLVMAAGLVGGHASVKTVERHVAHLFDKLGVSSRAAVASIVAGER